MNAAILEQAITLTPVFSILITIGLFIVVLQTLKKNRVQDRQIRQLHMELNALLACSRGISDKLHRYQHQFRNITERQDKLEIGDTEHTGYKQAIALYNRGASEEEMLSTCDLSRGELNLIAHLQRAQAKKSHQIQ